MITDNKYWDEVYSANKLDHEPSSFAQYIEQKYLSSGKSLLELGCGNGRDSLYFVENGKQVQALDLSSKTIENLSLLNIKNVEFLNQDFSNLAKFSDLDYVYSRFTMHSVDEETEKNEEEQQHVNEEVELGTNLKEQVLNEFDCFESAVALLKDMDDEEILFVVEQYQTWFESSSSSLYPSLAVEIVSKVHMIRPLVFAKASSIKHVVNLQSLVQDVRKQQVFMEKICYEKYQCETGIIHSIENSVSEYIHFLRRAGSTCVTDTCTQQRIEPSLIVDLVWHSHMQLFRGSVYCADSIRIGGRIVDHEF